MPRGGSRKGVAWFGHRAFSVGQVLPVAGMVAKSVQLIQTAVAQLSSGFSDDTLQLTQQMDQSQCVGLLDLVKQFRWLNSVEALAGHEKQTSGELRSLPESQKRLLNQ